MNLNEEQLVEGLSKLEDSLAYVLEEVGVAREYRAFIGHLGLGKLTSFSKLAPTEEKMSEVLSDDSEANDNTRSRGNATRYTLFHGPVNTRLEMPSTGFEAEDTRSKYGHNDFPLTNF